jgi:hypothetical protein
MRFFTLTTTLLIALALLPAAASAGVRQYALFQDENLIVENGGTRGATLDEARSLGVDMIKVQVNWATVAPGTRRKPSGFDGTDPSQYPGWTRYDDVLAAAKTRGFKVMFALAPPAPGWATPKPRDRAGVARPNPREFGRFAEAAARRFPGVDVWTIWNEPNHPGHLYPQSTKGGRPVAPHLYRALVRAAVAGLNRGGAGRDPILFGEMLPIGKTSSGPGRNLQPLRFLRAFFQGRPLSGLDGLAHHPYTRPLGPLLREPTPDDVTIRSLGRLLRTLDSARARGKLRSKKKLPIWNTEFGFQTDPPDPVLGARIAAVPRFWSLSELWFSYSNRRVKSISQYTMNDQAGDPSLWQSGLRFADGTAKSDIYSNFKLPILVRQLGPNAVEVRGAARPGGAGASVQVHVKKPRGQFRALGGPLGIRNVRGYFVQRFLVTNAAKKTFRFTTGGESSLAVKPVRIFR